jgi:hypothetical protein
VDPRAPVKRMNPIAALPALTVNLFFLRHCVLCALPVAQVKKELKQGNISIDNNLK